MIISFSSSASMVKKSRGFMLMEVLIAIAIISISIFPLISLMSVSQKGFKASSEETLAVDLLTSIIQDIRCTPLNQSESPIFKISGLPYYGAKLNIKNTVWVDSCWNIFSDSERPIGQGFIVEWTYIKLPEGNSFSPVEAAFTIKWPPKNAENATDNQSDGEFTQIIAFSKP